jgi:hypothetical protein
MPGAFIKLGARNEASDRRKSEVGEGMIDGILDLIAFAVLVPIVFLLAPILLVIWAFHRLERKAITKVSLGDAP